MPRQFLRVLCVGLAAALPALVTGRLPAEGLDGAVDPGLSGPELATAFVEQIVPRSDGSLIVKGSFSTYNGVRTGRFARVLPDGSLGPAVLNLPGVEPALANGVIEPAPNDGLWFWDNANFLAPTLRRLDSQGVPLAGTALPGSGSLSVIRAAPEGKLYVGGDFEISVPFTDFLNLARFHADLSLDESFAPYHRPNGPVQHILVQSDGRLLVSGLFGSVGLGETPTPGQYARLQTDGSLDPTFTVGSGVAGPAGAYPKPLYIDAQGRSYWTQLISAPLTGFNGVPRNAVVRLLPDGAVDLGFDAQFAAGDVVTAVHQTADGKVMVLGFFRQAGGGARTSIARLTDSGALDPTFEVLFQGYGNLGDLAPAPNGGWYLGGSFSRVDGVASSGLLRVLATGSPDATFAPQPGPGGGAPTVRAILPLPDGRFLVAGAYQESAPGVPAGSILRLQASGAVDATFSTGSSLPDGQIVSIVRQADGRLVVAGAFRRIGGLDRTRIARLLPDGGPDPSFDPGSGFDATVQAVRQLSDGSLFAIGAFRTFNGQPAPGVARLTVDGQRHPDFNPGAGFTGTYQLEAMDVGPGNRLVICGSFTSYAGATRYRVLELLPSGALSASALGTVQTLTSGSVRAVAMDAQGATFVARYGRIHRFDPAGILDTSYVAQLPGTATSPTIDALLPHPDGTLLVGANAVHRLLPGGGPDPSFTTQPAVSRDFGYAPSAGLAGRVRALAFGPNRANVLVGGTFHTLGGLERRGFARLLARPFDAWLGEHFSAAELSDPAFSGELADPDGDGIVNLLEYAFALDPRAARQTGLPAVAVVTRRGEPGLELTYTRRKVPRAVVYAVEASSNLQDWSPANATETEVIDQGATELVTVREPVAALPGARRFLRLRVRRG